MEEKQVYNTDVKGQQTSSVFKRQQRKREAEVQRTGGEGGQKVEPWKEHEAPNWKKHESHRY